MLLEVENGTLQKEDLSFAQKSRFFQLTISLGKKHDDKILSKSDVGNKVKWLKPPRNVVFCVSTKSLSTKSSPLWKEIHFQGKCFFQENSRNDHSILFRREFKVKKRLPNAQRNCVFFCVCLFEKNEVFSCGKIYKGNHHLREVVHFTS